MESSVLLGLIANYFTEQRQQQQQRSRRVKARQHEFLLPTEPATRLQHLSPRTTHLICHTPFQTQNREFLFCDTTRLGLNYFFFHSIFAQGRPLVQHCTTTIGIRMTAFSGIIDSKLRYQTSLVFIVRSLLVYCIKKRWRLSSFCFLLFPQFR
jgi:hypothetical protein